MLIENGAGAAIDPEEVEGVTETDEEEEESVSTDPLDAIEDEAARNLAKAERAKARREARKEPVTKVEPEPISTAYATKDDLKKIATNDAKKMVAPEVLAVWDELMAIPLGGFDPMDSTSIASNVAQRFVLYQQKLATSEDPSKAFTASPTIPHSGGPSNQKPTEPKPLPGYKEPTPPTEWYK